MAENKLTFAEACERLQISEEELERLVAGGEISSLKEGDTFFFKPEAIDQFQKSRKTEPTIILSDDEMDLLDGVEEIDLDELELPVEDSAVSGESTPAAAAEVSFEADGDDLQLEDLELDELNLQDDSQTPKAQDDLGEITLDDDDLALEQVPLEADDLSLDLDVDTAPSDDTKLNLEGLLEEDLAAEGTTPVPGTDMELDLEVDDITLEGSVDEETILDTDVLELTDEDEDFQLDAGDEDELTVEATASTLIRGGGARVMQMKRVRTHALWTFFLLLNAIVMLVPLAVLINIYFFDGVGEREAAEPNAAKASQWIHDHNYLRGMIEPISDTIEDFKG